MISVKIIVAAIVVVLSACASWAESPVLSDISLPTPRTEGGKPLMQTLKERQTARSFSTKKLSTHMVSDLLWSAFGINRPDSGKRTAPSARNWQEMEVYVIMRRAPISMTPSPIN